MTDDPDKRDAEQAQDDAPSEESSGKEDRKPPPDDLEKDPAYEPDEPFKGIKGG